MGSIDICPGCGGEVRVHFNDINGIVSVSGKCWNCGRLLSRRLTPVEDREPKKEPEGELTGWRLAFCDPDRGWFTREYGLNEKDLLEKHVEECRSILMHYDVSEVRA